MVTTNDPVPGVTLPALDLAECEREPIHRLGLVQPHGVVLLVGGPDQSVQAVSANVAGILAREPVEIVGHPLASLLPADALEPLLAAPSAGLDVVLPTVVVELGGGRASCDVTAHRHGGLLVVEIEPRGRDDDARAARWSTLRDGILSALGGPEPPERIAQRLCAALRAATEVDRVWLYRFAPDWSGEVIAEDCSPGVPPYLGLHYPASDIPPQARTLYRSNLLRVIVDVNATPVSLLPSAGPRLEDQPDLSHAILRSVSHYHIEYLQNLGVGSTATVSLLTEGELWGMLSLHHGTMRRSPPSERRVLARVALGLSQLVERAAQERRVAAERRSVRLGSSHAAVLDDAGSLLHATVLGSPGLRELTGSNGIAVVAGDAVVAAGAVPEPDWLRELARWAVDRAGGDALAVDALPEVYPPAAGRSDVAAGALVFVVSREPPVLLLGFRGEQTREVFWGGDPNAPATVDAVTQRISPRKSFDLWRQLVRGHSVPWDADVVDRVRVAARSLVERAGGPSQLSSRLAAESDGILARALRDCGDVGSVLDATNNGFLLLLESGASPNLRSVLVNRRFRETFGTDLHATTGVALSAQLESLGLARLLERDGTWPRTIDVFSPDLGARALRISRRLHLALSTPSTECALYAFDLVDVTAETRLQQALAAARERADAADRLKSAMLRNVSHELRTPLNAILGLTEIVADDDQHPLSVEQADLLAHVRSAGHHLLSLVEDLLDLGRLEAMAAREDWVSVDVAELVRDVGHSVEVLARPKQIECRWSIPPEDVRLDGSRRALRQILTNLLGNAVKFTPPGGSVGCEVSASAIGRVTLRVWDTGIGIAAADQRRIFDPFVQVDASDARRYGGCGLGLALVRAYVALHSGTVTVSSSEGRGAAFTVELPAHAGMP